MVEARARHEERSFDIEELEIERRHGSARRPEQRHHAAGSQAVQAPAEGRGPHAVVDHVHAAAAGDALHLGHEVLRGVEDDVVRPRRPRQRGLLLRGHRPDHGRAAHLGHLAEEEPHAARRRVHEAGLALLDGIGGAHEVVGRHSLEHRGGAVAEGQPVGELHEAIGGADVHLGVGAQDPRVGHPIADLDVGDAGPHPGDGAGALETGSERQGGLGGAGAEIDVDVVEPGRLERDNRLPCARGGLRDILELHHLGPAGRVDANRLHVCSPVLVLTAWLRDPA